VPIPLRESVLFPITDHVAPAEHQKRRASRDLFPYQQPAQPKRKRKGKKGKKEKGIKPPPTREPLLPKHLRRSCVKAASISSSSSIARTIIAKFKVPTKV
jgi:hypothetical protein